MEKGPTFERGPERWPTPEIRREKVAKYYLRVRYDLYFRDLGLGVLARQIRFLDSRISSIEEIDSARNDTVLITIDSIHPDDLAELVAEKILKIRGVVSVSIDKVIQTL